VINGSLPFVVPFSSVEWTAPPSVTAVRSMFFDSHTVSLESAVDLITEARYFTLRSCSRVTLPDRSFFHVYSVLPKRGNCVSVARLLRHEAISPLFWLSSHYPELPLLRDGLGFLFFVTLTPKASIFDRDKWNTVLGSRYVDLFKKRVEAYLRPDLPAGCHVQFSRVDEAHESGFIHYHLFMFVPQGLPVYQSRVRKKVFDADGRFHWLPKSDKAGKPVFMWRVGSSGDRSLKDSLNDLWVSADPLHQVNNIDISAVPTLYRLGEYALKYQFKFFPKNSVAERRRDWTLGILSLYRKRGYSFSKSFASAFCDFVSAQSGKDLRLDVITRNLRKESPLSFWDSLPEGFQSVFVDVFSDDTLRAHGFDPIELSQRFFKTDKEPPVAGVTSSYSTFFEYPTVLQPVPVQSLFLASAGSNYSSVTELNAIPGLLSKAKRKLLVVDVETIGRDQYSSPLVGIGVAFEGYSFYFAVGHVSEENLDLNEVISVLNPLLSSSEVVKVFHNAAFDISVLERHGFDVTSPVFDTMVAAHCWDSSKISVSLNKLALNLLGVFDTSTYESVVNGFVDMSFVPVERVGRYCREDVLLTLGVAQFLLKLFESSMSSAGLRNSLSLDMQMIFTLLWVESSGIRFDCSSASELSKRFDERLSVLRPEIIAAAGGREFNFFSSKQVGKVLYDDLKLPVNFWTPSGSPAANSNTLKSLVSCHPLPGLLLEYRGLLKLKRDFVENMSEHSVEGMVCTNFNLTTTSTGRLSSSSPNLQNIPKDSCPEASEIRKLFVPSDPAHVLVRADYQQMELRMAAVLAQDPVLLAAFRRGEDPHRTTASLLFEKDVCAVSPLERSVGKKCNFAVLYGQGARGFADAFNLKHPDSKISIQDAELWLKRFFSSYPRFIPFFDSVIDFARMTGFSETVYGSRRWFVDKFEFKVGSAINAAEREIKNFVIQGACAVVLKRAMVSIHDEFIAAGLRARMVLTVHDELVFDVPKLEEAAVCGIVRRCMESAAGMPDSFPVDLSVCSDWGTPLPSVPEASSYV